MKKFSTQHTLLALACVGALALSACKPEAPEATPKAMPEIAPVATDVTPMPESAPAFDQKGFAGTFKGSLPAADGTNVDTTIELMADGMYVINEMVGKAAPKKMDGSWTAEENGSRIRLDPNTKAEDDRLYAITSKDQLDPLGVDGKPVAGAMAGSLKREGAATMAAPTDAPASTEAPAAAH
ncbi:copper resistance protein NlpE N-terminal domain-containing protein [Montanilutibacter psychrotolerans]|uniref:Copper resistance protein NlpE n=1 Tax=Montanilutibacter psychrotolerans TaxID=1327343 RepID=A0A3M8SV02_9GAMM|nr:copper resistance protein NlpE N-terminal domain-containing protein [Lysobacter psychrotolerans]RNF85168.1 hypothetical protein EER27_05175 [Lysobacter psychrotolerans]